MNLYELTGELISLRQMAEDGEIDSQTFDDTWESIEGAFEDKAEGYAKVRADIISDIAGIDAEIKRLTEKKARMNANKERLEKALESAMKTTGKTKFSTLLFNFNIKKNPPHVVPDSEKQTESKIPEEFWKPQEPKLDKAKLKAFIKLNGDTEWAHMEQSESLSIK